jgi:hypothetical protein
MQQIEWLQFWYDALASKRGVVVAVSDVALARAKLYQARAASGDPALSDLQCRISPVLPSEELWLVKGTPSGEKVSGTS